MQTTYGQAALEHGRIVIDFGVIAGEPIQVDVTPYVVPLARDLLIAAAERDAEYEEANETPYRCTGCGQLDHVHAFPACGGSEWVASPR